MKTIKELLDANYFAYNHSIDKRNLKSDEPSDEFLEFRNQYFKYYQNFENPAAFMRFYDQVKKCTMEVNGHKISPFLFCAYTDLASLSDEFRVHDDEDIFYCYEKACYAAACFWFELPTITWCGERLWFASWDHAQLFARQVKPIHSSDFVQNYLKNRVFLKLDCALNLYDFRQRFGIR